MLINSLNELGLNQANFPIYFQDNYLKHENSVGSNLRTNLYVYKELEAIIVFTTVKLKIITKAQYLFTPHNFKGYELDATIEKKVLDEFHQFLTKSKLADVILPPPHYCLFKSIPTKSLYYEMGIIAYDINSKKGRFLEAMKSNYRNEIRKIENSNELEFKSGDAEFDKAYDLMKRTHENQNLSFVDQTLFDSIKKNLSSNYLLLTCELEKKTLGAVLFLLDYRKAYYLYAGNDKTKEYPGINKMLMLEAFKHFHSIGISEVILGGYRNENKASSKIIGIQQFKLRFGADVCNGYHFIKVINPIKYKTFNLLLKIKSLIIGKHMELLNLSGLELKKSI